MAFKFCPHLWQYRDPEHTPHDLMMESVVLWLMAEEERAKERALLDDS